MDFSSALRTDGEQRVDVGGKGQIRVEIASDQPVRNPSVSSEGNSETTLAIDNTGAFRFRPRPFGQRNAHVGGLIAESVGERVAKPARSLCVKLYYNRAYAGQSNSDD